MHVHLQLPVKTGFMSLLKAYLPKTEEDKKCIGEEKSSKTFKFGGGEVRSSINVLLFQLRLLVLKEQ